MVAFRLDPRLQGRVDASDIIQEAHLEAAAHREDYFRHGELPLFLWLRGVVGNKLLKFTATIWGRACATPRGMFASLIEQRRMRRPWH
ncbi:MAG TPA: hypothetical protein VGQ99_14360 [Tepidisphaeraceae bacterium]|nr:hypothetical protein [Tepidisphaeraceae bacterium]